MPLWHRLGGIDARADQKILPDLRRVEIFWGWRSEPLSALPTIPVTLLLCFGVFESNNHWRILQYRFLNGGNNNAGHTAKNRGGKSKGSDWTKWSELQGVKCSPDILAIGWHWGLVSPKSGRNGTEGWHERNVENGATLAVRCWG